MFIMVLVVDFGQNIFAVFCVLVIVKKPERHHIA